MQLRQRQPFEVQQVRHTFCSKWLGCDTAIT